MLATTHVHHGSSWALHKGRAVPRNHMKRPKVVEQQPSPLSWQQLEQLVACAETRGMLRELGAVHLLAGHGWRQNELLEMTGGDVRRVRDGTIWCRGKERDEAAPLLPETAALLRELAKDVPDDGQVFPWRAGAG